MATTPTDLFLHALFELLFFMLALSSIALAFLFIKGMAESGTIARWIDRLQPPARDTVQNEQSNQAMSALTNKPRSKREIEDDFSVLSNSIASLARLASKAITEYQKSLDQVKLISTATQKIELYIGQPLRKPKDAKGWVEAHHITEAINRLKDQTVRELFRDDMIEMRFHLDQVLFALSAASGQYQSHSDDLHRDIQALYSDVSQIRARYLETKAEFLKGVNNASVEYLNEKIDKIREEVQAGAPIKTRGYIRLIANKIGV